MPRTRVRFRRTRKAYPASGPIGQISGTHTTTAREGHGSSPGAVHTAKVGQDGFTSPRQSHHTRHVIGATHWAARLRWASTDAHISHAAEPCRRTSNICHPIVSPHGPCACTHAPTTQTLFLSAPTIQAGSRRSAPAACTNKKFEYLCPPPPCALRGGRERPVSRRIATPLCGGEGRLGPLHSHS